MSDYREEKQVAEDQGASRIAWFLTGAALGATVALLYAPKSGRDTREYISKRAQQGRDAVETAGENIADTSREMFERGRKLVEDAADLFERGRKLVRG
ncbi:MAG: YtxH domain-containing protein [Acidobacteriota bacterium]|nr:YtxH domain-containing protein [Acidobacteriota bacterium]